MGVVVAVEAEAVEVQAGSPAQTFHGPTIQISSLTTSQVHCFP